MLEHDYYFGLTKKYVTIFGLLFNNINISRVNDDDQQVMAMKVPLTWAAKDKIIVRLKEDPNITTQPAITLPRMAFNLMGVGYNPDRKLNKIHRVVKLGDDANTVKTQFTPVPYDLNFQLYVYAKNYEDGNKIVEQILPFFTPDYTVTAILVPELNISMDIPVVLKSVNVMDNYEGDFQTRRAIIWTLDFNMQGYFYGPVVNKPLIKFVETNVFVGDRVSYANDKIVGLTVQPGLTANGEPTSNVSLSIDVDQIWASNNWGMVEIINEGPFQANT